MKNNYAVILKVGKAVQWYHAESVNQAVSHIMADLMTIVSADSKIELKADMLEILNDNSIVLNHYYEYESLIGSSVSISFEQLTAI